MNMHLLPQARYLPSKWKIPFLGIHPSWIFIKMPSASLINSTSFGNALVKRFQFVSFPIPFSRRFMKRTISQSYNRAVNKSGIIKYSVIWNFLNCIKGSFTQEQTGMFLSSIDWNIVVVTRLFRWGRSIMSLKAWIGCAYSHWIYKIGHSHTLLKIVFSRYGYIPHTW